MVIFKNFYGQNLIQIYAKMHQIAPFKKNREACPRTPLAKRMSRSHMQIFKSEKKIIGPLPNPGYAPGYLEIMYAYRSSITTKVPL